MYVRTFIIVMQDNFIFAFYSYGFTSIIIILKCIQPCLDCLSEYGQYNIVIIAKAQVYCNSVRCAMI